MAEYKRIQGFPDEHLFYGDRSAQIRQIGNSVCPKIAYYMALAIREQIFGVPSGITYLQPTDVLSFDMRKGRKAQSTKALHQAVLEKSKNNPTDIFQLFEFEDHVTPTLSKKHNNMKVTISDESLVMIDVRSDSCSKIQAVLRLAISDGINRKIELKVTVRGEGQYGVQTMWNAVDAWVKKASHFHSLVELYGHFTEPHPIFEVLSFENRTELPIFKFAEHCMCFDNCSVYFPKETLLAMWGNTFAKDSFIELAKELRRYRFDVRCHETNIAIPQGVYMVAYPFALPYDKQMNFFVREV